MPKLITIEEHFDTQTAAQLFAQHDPMHTANPLPLENKLLDITDRLKYMDQHNIQMQILSDAGNNPQNFAPEIAIPACQAVNDALAKIIAAHPDRFGGFAILPVNDPEAAATELRRAITELHFQGALIGGTIDNQWLDNPRFLPIFAAAAELGAPIYLHPGYPNAQEDALMYKSDAYSDAMRALLASFGFGWHMDSGLQMIRLIMSGIFDKLPQLKLISGHWGEFVPGFFERLDGAGHMPGVELKQPFSSYYKNNVYITPSGMFTKSQFNMAYAQMGGISHMIYSEDYPYVQSADRLQTFFDDMDINSAEKEMFAHGNAEQLFKLI